MIPMKAVIRALWLVSVLAGAMPFAAVAATKANAMPPIVKTMEEGVVPVSSDFVVGPTSFDLEVAPGQDDDVTLLVINRQGKTVNFRVTAEDFSADPRNDGTVQLFGDTAGPFPARNWLQPAATEFSLRHGERATIPVKIAVPADADVGDHYAALIIERVNENVTKDTTHVEVISRIGSLFLVRVPGTVDEEGSFLSLHPLQNVFFSYPASIALKAQNTGTVRLKPIGTLTIRNIFGSVVDSIVLHNWTLLRASEGQHVVEWHPPFALGPYSVEASMTLINGQEPSVLRSSFWILPVVPLLLFLVLLVFLAAVLRFLRSRFRVVIQRT